MAEYGVQVQDGQVKVGFEWGNEGSLHVDVAASGISNGVPHESHDSAPVEAAEVHLVVDMTIIVHKRTNSILQPLGDSAVSEQLIAFYSAMAENADINDNSGDVRI